MTATKTKIHYLALAVLAVVLAAVMAAAATASPAQAKVRYGDTTTADSGYTMLYVSGSFVTSQRQKTLDYINKVRKEACTEGVKNPSTGKKLTSADYVPIKWSSVMEWIAQTRAAEASVRASHTRPNDVTCLALRYENITPSAECLAWGSGSAYEGGNMLANVKQWYAEKSDYVNGGSGETGHYKALINPVYRYVGIGTFASSENEWASTTAGEFSMITKGLDETMSGVTGKMNQAFVAKNVSSSDTKQVAAKVSGKSAVYVGNTTKYTLKAKLHFDEAITTNAVANFFGKTTWTSSNKKVATISSAGKLVAKKAGKVTLTATNANGFTAKKTINIYKNIKITKAKPGRGSLLVKWSKTKGAKAYLVCISTSKKFTKATTQKFSKTGKWIKLLGMQSGKTYYVKVGAGKWSNGYIKCSSWSKVKKVKIK